MMRAYATIGRPRHEFGAACISADAYRGMLMQSLRDLHQRFPDRPWGEPHRADAPVEGPQIRHGIWKVRCGCSPHEYPIYDPEWKAACCFACGAMYEHVEPPAHWHAIEAVLLQRSTMTARNFLPHETLAALCAENLEHGDSLPALGEDVPWRM